ncbi:MAG: [LysW]-lysine hydrolase [Anaerolineaceae bacterium]|nr:[LysW]-lysine hydrolase [Anaerolineaceae bacterium]
MSQIPLTLLGLVQKYSPTGSESPAVEWLIQRMQVLGFDSAFRDTAGNAVGIKGTGTNTIVLLGHIDTVPGEIEIRIEDDTLFGRGSVDAKGSLAAFADAVSAVQVQEDWQIVVIGAVDEEGNSKGARSICDLYQPRYAIIGEPSQWSRVTLGYKGVHHASLSCNLPLVHSSQGASASDKLLNVWQMLKTRIQTFNNGRSIFEQIIPTVLSMKSANDGFQMDAAIEISVRLPVDVSPIEWSTGWLGTMEGVTIGSKDEGLPAFRADKNSKLTRAFLGAIRNAGGKPRFVNKSGTSDLNVVAPVWQCPIVAYGPGDSNLDHTPNEHIHTAEYQQALSVLQAVFKRLGITIA